MPFKDINSALNDLREEQKEVEKLLKDFFLNKKISLRFDPASVRKEDITEILLAISNLYRAIGGDNLIILDSGVSKSEVEAEPQLK